MIEKGIFVKIPLTLYQKLEKKRIEKNMKQKEFLQRILKNYLEDEKDENQ